MHYTKAMVDLIMAARRIAPSEAKASIKLANPNVLFELAELYHRSRDNVFKALVKEVFSLAGDPWPEKLLSIETGSESSSAAAESTGYLTKIYRGQTLLQQKSVVAEALPETQEAVQDNRPKRIYRGQVVA